MRVSRFERIYFNAPTSGLFPTEDAARATIEKLVSMGFSQYLYRQR